MYVEMKHTRGALLPAFLMDRTAVDYSRLMPHTKQASRRPLPTNVRDQRHATRKLAETQGAVTYRHRDSDRSRPLDASLQYALCHVQKGTCHAQTGIMSRTDRHMSRTERHHVTYIQTHVTYRLTHVTYR